MEEREPKTTSQEAAEPEDLGAQDPAASPQGAVSDRPPEEEQPIDQLEAMRQELAEAQARQAEYLDGWQRARAELANARKRYQREQEQSYDNARAAVLVRLLPIVDDFERALESLDDDLATASWAEGIRLIDHKFQQLLQAEGVSTIEAQGQEFDPLLHQAVTHEASETVPAGHVISVLQNGYRIGDQVLRPAVVRVSSGPEIQAQDEAEADADTTA